MVNHVVLQGRLTRDPELRSTANGVEVCNFTVAWSETYKDQERKLFCDCTAWRKTGVFVDKYFAKGQQIAVEGYLETQQYTDKDGNKRSTIKLICDKVHFCGDKSSGGPAESDKMLENQTVEFEELPPADDEEEIPF